MAKKKGEIEFKKEFYRNLGVSDEKIFSNIEMGIELYLGKHDRKSRLTDAATHFERSMGIFSTSYVRMVQEILRSTDNNLCPSQSFFINFGALDPRLVQNPRVIEELRSESVSSFDTAKYEMFYLTEWLEKIGRGRITLSADKAKVKSKSTLEEKGEKLKEKKNNFQAELDAFCKEENDIYYELKGMFKLFSPSGNQEEKIKILKKIKEKVKKLEKAVNEENIRYAEIDAIERREKGVSDKMDDFAAVRMDRKFTRIREEFEFITSAMRSCAARGGLMKSTPALIDKWIPLDERLNINTKHNLAEALSRFEDIDYTVFHNKKGERKSPKFLILPGVGTGISWSDRMLVSLFPPPSMQPDISLARTLAGFWWYKATSSFNWKHLPGELGSMYQLIYPDKTFARLQRSFEDDYVNWVMKESMGYQVISSDVRRLFWQKIPFSRELKQKLSKRATVYMKLYSEELAHGS